MMTVPFIKRTLPKKMKFSIKNFFSKCDQIHSFLQIWSYLLKKSLMKNLIFCAVERFCYILKAYLARCQTALMELFYENNFTDDWPSSKYAAACLLLGVG